MLQRRRSPGPGIRYKNSGYEVRGQFRGIPFGTIFPLTATTKEMQEWRKDQTAKLRTLHAKPNMGTFAADAEKYLKAVAALTTIKERIYHIGLWVKIFGARRRASITSVDIRTQVEQWKLEGTLAPNTINNRLRALSNVWTVLDGKRAPNPVRDVPLVPDRELIPRALPTADIEAILAAMPDRGRPTGQGKGTRPKASQTKARLRVIFRTGLAHKELMRLEPHELDLVGRTMRVKGRRKGKGTTGKTVPLFEEGVAAFGPFIALNCWGPFSASAMRKSFQRACQKLDVKGATPYHLRHSYATEMLEKTGDVKMTQQLMRHADSRTTLRYALGAIPTAMLAAVEKVQRARVDEAKERASQSSPQPIVPGFVPADERR
jgi:integrase